MIKMESGLEIHRTFAADVSFQFYCFIRSFSLGDIRKFTVKTEVIV